MTTFWWVRHGPTHARAMVGWSDLPADLSDNAALGRLSAYLPAEAPVVSSDLIRARATADAIQGTRPRLPDQRGLREIHFGAWEMRRFAEIEAEDPDRIRAYYESPGQVRPPGGESWNDVSARVGAAVDTLCAAHPDGQIIAVAHFGVILSQVQRALGLSATEAFAQQIDPLSVTRIVHHGGWQVEEINHIL